MIFYRILHFTCYWLVTRQTQISPCRVHCRRHILIELIMIHFTAEKPLTFTCDIRSDGPMARNSLAKSNGSLLASTIRPTSGFGQLVALVVPLLSSCW